MHFPKMLVIISWIGKSELLNTGNLWKAHMPNFTFMFPEMTLVHINLPLLGRVKVSSLSVGADQNSTGLKQDEDENS